MTEELKNPPCRIVWTEDRGRADCDTCGGSTNDCAPIPCPWVPKRPRPPTTMWDSSLVPWLGITAVILACALWWWVSPPASDRSIECAKVGGVWVHEWWRQPRCIRGATGAAP